LASFFQTGPNFSYVFVADASGDVVVDVSSTLNGRPFREDLSDFEAIGAGFLRTVVTLAEVGGRGTLVDALLDNGQALLPLTAGGTYRLSVLNASNIEYPLRDRTAYLDQTIRFAIPTGSVPLPSTFVLMGIGFAALLAGRRRPAAEAPPSR
jgi:hypothetical protein